MVNYNKVIKEPLTEENKIAMGELTPKPFVNPILTSEEVTPAVQEQSDEATVVCHSSLNVRESADITSRVVAILTPGDTVAVGIVNGDWAQIYTASGIHGYSLKQFIVPKPIE